MKNIFLLFTAISLFAIFSCEKNEIDLPATKICSAIQQDSFPLLKSELNNYLQNNIQGNSEDDLEKLARFISDQTCISRVETVCYVCIFTLPPQSELKVFYDYGNLQKEFILDVIMTEPMEVHNMH
ncbi:MAG: hypothetical protein R2879_08275 [Saprospiraceae bacterium]